MATTIAHELNQPLTAASSLMGAAQLTLEKNTDERSARAIDLLEDSVSEIRRASDIIRQMRDFVRKRKTAPSLYDINQVVTEASTIALIGAEAEGISVTKNLQPDLPISMIDRIQIQQVVTNLIRNAIDAMTASAERHLTIATGYRDGMIEITVEDTGPGIDGAILPKLFEPFLTTKETGMGIGLSISKSIVDAHQGKLSAINKNTRGCIFTVSLPAGTRNGLSSQ
nr:ATP-binding protein [Aquisalinus flavus]